MCKITDDEIFLFKVGIFEIRKRKNHYFELRTKSGQYWCVYKEAEGIILLLHKHHLGDNYHIHYVYENTSKAMSEILQHERYIERRKKNHQKICGNRRIKIVL